MGPKRKTIDKKEEKEKESSQQQPQPPPEKAPNIMLKIVTSEGAEFKIHEQLFVRYSHRAKLLSDAAKDHVIHLKEIDSETFRVINDYLELHKDKEPAKIVVPIRTNQSLGHIMEEGDAELVEKVAAEGDMAILKAMDACLFLQLESLRKRLACSVAIKLMGSTVEELKEMYELSDSGFDEDAMRKAILPQIEQAKKMNMEEQI